MLKRLKSIFSYAPQKRDVIKGLAAATFLVMLLMNALANILPINGLNTGAISDMYENYFAPAGFTFSIWAVIYIGLGIYVFGRFTINKSENYASDNHLFYAIDIAFIVTNLANLSWILAWHYLALYVSLFHMIVLLLGLIYINLKIKHKHSKWFMPFRIYFGWITIATVANVTTLIVSDQQTFNLLWRGGEVSEVILTTIILGITIVIGNVTLLRQKDVFYGLVVVWALFGIYMRHTVNLPDFGIVGVANTALIGVFITLSIVMFITLKKMLSMHEKSETPSGASL